ncbi:hypothetical protein CARUB_v10022397mg [Capsella rubella]|uniref:RING-type domain-containing protein n=1 Tax=Capsella rubella TaxID=81985 RepID=R0HY56_9BRAS|nr:hypothetical protein CARUB_v10022397mg [Capsella rubella]
MSLVILKSLLGNLRLYKFDVPSESDVGVLIISTPSEHTIERFQLTRYTGRGRGRGSKAGLSKAFVDLVDWQFMMEHESNIPNQIFDYIVSNYSFKDLDVVPPAGFSQSYVPEIDITPAILHILRTRDSVLSVEDARTRLVPIHPPTLEIVDCYQSLELCRICEKGYPKKDEIVYKTKCNHIFHATCISRYLLHTPRCPICSVELPPVDIRTLLFN